MFATIAFALSIINIFILVNKPVRASRPATIVLITFACLALLLSRTVALGTEARNHIHLTEKGNVDAHGMAHAMVEHSTGQLIGTHRILAKANKSSIPVDALKAVERSQQASPNTGDSDTEAHENFLDETRVNDDSGPDFTELERVARPPNLNGTFIVSTHRGESW